MPLVLQLEADSHQELVSLAIKTLGIQAVDKIEVALPAPVPLPPQPQASLPAPEPRPIAKRRGRPPAAPTPPAAAPAAVLPPAPAAVPAVAAPQAPAATAQPAVSGVSSSAATDFLPAATPPAAAAGGLTPEDVRLALHALNGAAGGMVATDMLKKYGADRVSTIPEARRAEFIAECKAVAVKAEAAKQS